MKQRKASRLLTSLEKHKNFTKQFVVVVDKTPQKPSTSSRKFTELKITSLKIIKAQLIYMAVC